MALCPHCQRQISVLNIEIVTLSDEKMASWRGVTYSCPECNTVLSAGFDPVALERDLVNAVVAGLRKGSQS
jgi:hypothetical protein